MAIQGKQVPMYTKHTLFLYFCDFSIFLYEKQNWKVNRQKHVKQSNCIKLDWLKTWKQNTQVMQTQKQEAEREREKMRESLRTLFLPHLGRTFPFSKPLIRRWGGRIKTFQVWKEHDGFKKISKRSEGGWKLILVSWCDHAIALLSG